MISNDGLPNTAWLIPLDGSRKGETLLLSMPSTTLGSAEPADIVLPDPEMDRLHATIMHAHGGYTLVDSDSKTGIYLNQRRGTRFDLVDNDVIRLGNTQLKFKTIV